MEKKAADQNAKKSAKPPRPPGKPRTESNTPTLVITVDGSCKLENNQGLDPPHLSKSSGGGFPHQVRFTAVAQAWVCLPAGVFTQDPPVPLELLAGTVSGPFIVKGDTALNQINFSHSCDKPCAAHPGHLGNGDVIIINA